MRRVQRTESGCWLWLGPYASKGYGRVHVAGKRPLAHRYFYETAIGPVPAGLQLDHLCRVRACVNPEHLEPVTNAENSRRGANAFLLRTGVCRKGHAGERVVVGGKPMCRACSRETHLRNDRERRKRPEVRATLAERSRERYWRIVSDPERAEAHKKRNAERSRAWYRANRAYAAEAQRLRRAAETQEERAARAAYHKAWAAAHPDLVRKYRERANAKAQAMRKGAA